MLEILQLNDVSIEIEGHILLENINTTVQHGDRIGVIGKNGAGKSTLLDVLQRQRQPTEGKINYPREKPIFSIVEQETKTHTFDQASPLESALLEKWQVPNLIYNKLSGGEKLKARLARGIAQNADILLLDEPTNHLDKQGRRFLIEQLNAWRGSIIFVSHDREFLDAVATKIWAIEDQTVTPHLGNYSSYMKARDQKRLTQQREYEKQQKMKQRVEAQIKELDSWSQKAHEQSTKKDGFKEYYRVKAKRMDAQVKSKQKRLEKELEKIDAEPVEPEYKVNFTMESNQKVGKRFVEFRNVRKSFGDRNLFNNVQLTIQHGEKVAISGANGSGKTTFLNILMGLETANGDIWMSPTAEIGYLTQEVFDLPLDQSPAQLFHQKTYQDRGIVQNLMKHLGFTASQWGEPIYQMSMGERVKCKLMKYILEEKDVLILDEPTNHLDIASREQLEETLAAYNGTLIVVTHDQYFQKRTTNIELRVENQTVVKHSEQARALDDKEKTRLQLETERQEILGRLSFMTPQDKDYKHLDARFNELTEKIKEL
ncbi:ribosomal protection-like ABC-F family protein [Virgibacillus sp. SK37]|uniref:ribosomal protection-like ABC-F family protein n=1 Tax=Virgibacillus sp. SK37 TaxID=403957 RepID=UPI0004D1ADD1|nr:ABC-F type ribosomal protection protein [Virgibacillus sp. SK37]AIF43022.1 elongation factor 3 [Virgibacillus sp. SK37]